MRMIRKTLALSLVLAAIAAPAWAQADFDAYETQVPALTLETESNRLAAVAYMNDAMKLLNAAELQLREGAQQQAVSALIGASGKLTYAYLDLFEDRSFSQEIWPLTMAAEEASRLAMRDPEQALALVSAMIPEVASLYQVQVAQLGGGAGAGFEVIEDLEVPETLPE